MASGTGRPEGGNSSEFGVPDDSSPTIVLHVLSPSLEAPNRITLNDLPLATKIGELKDHIYHAVASKPRPETQRLIYRGKPLLNDGEALQNIVEPPDVSATKVFLRALKHSQMLIICFFYRD